MAKLPDGAVFRVTGTRGAVREDLVELDDGTVSGTLAVETQLAIERGEWFVMAPLGPRLKAMPVWWRRMLFAESLLDTVDDLEHELSLPASIVRARALERGAVA